MKKIMAIFCVVFIYISVFNIPHAYAFTPTTFDVNAGHALLVNLDTGEKVYSKDTSSKIYPASLTKLLTALIVYEHVSDIDNTVITVKGDLIDQLLGTDSSLAYIKDGEQLTVNLMLHYLLISSGNDVSLVLADYVGEGNTNSFVNMMNKKANELGMINSHFQNPHGLHNEQHYTTVDDLYLLTKAALNVPLIKEIISMSRYSVPETNKNTTKTIVNTNYLIDQYTDYYYSYTVGGKTGYTDPAGRCLVSFATKNGSTYLCIIMKCDPESKTRLEFIDSINLYKWAFSTFQYKTIVDETEAISGVKVNLSWSTDYIQLYPEKSVTALIPKDANKSTIIHEIKLISKTVDAPIAKGQKIGTADIYYAGEKIGETNLVAGDSVERSKILYLWKLIRDLYSSIWMKMILLAIVLAILILIIITILQNRNRKKRKRVKLYKHI